MSAAFLTAPKLPEAFCDKTVRPCEPVSVNCLSEPEKLHCLDIIQINEAIEATKLQPLTNIPVVKATTYPRSAGRNFVALSFLVNGQYFKDYHKIPGTLGLDHVGFN